QREALDGLHAVLHVLAGGLGPALGLDGVADGLDVQSGYHQAAIVEDAGLLLLGSRLALRLVHRVDVLDDLEIPANPGKLQRVVALGYLIPAGSLDVGLGGAPHQRDHLAQRVALALELLDGDRRRPAEQMRDHEVGLVAPGDVEHLRAHFHAGRGDGKGLELEALGFGEVLENGDRVLAGGVVEEQIGDLLALQASAQILLDERDRGSGLRPVAGRQWEDVGIALAVGGRGVAEARRGAEDLVLLELLGQRRDLRSAVDAFEYGALHLEALVRLHGRRHLVLVVDLEHADLVAFDAALAVNEADVVVIAGAKEYAHGLRGAGAVALQAEHQLLVLRAGTACRQRHGAGSDRRYAPTRAFRHCISS